jgi:two-component system cell cycle sensor histidine kinase/response regulator CckA
VSDESLRRLSILHELLATLSGSMDFDGELDRLSEALARALVLDAVAIFPAGEAPPRASVGLGRARGRAVLPASTAARLSGPGVLDEGEARSALPGVDVARGEARAVPLVADGVARGALVVARSLGPLDAFSLDVLASLAPRLGIVLHHEGLRRERERLQHDAQERVLADLRERGELAARMLATERLKGAILEVALEAVVIIDDHGDLVEFNPAAERMFGRRREEVLGRSMGDLLVPPSHRAAHQAGMERYLRTGEATVAGRRLELPALRADGTEFLAEVAIVRLEVGGKTQFAGFMRDVGELRRAEAELRAERARFSSMFEHAPDPSLIVDGKGVIMLANRACEEVLGWTRAELHGMPVDQLVPDDARARHAGHRASYAADHSARRLGGDRATLAVRRKDGVVVPADIALSPFELDGARHVVVTVRDVSARVRAEEERARLADQLRQSQKLQSLGTLAGGVAHYFNNMLAAIVANVELAQERVPASDPVRENLDQVAEASARGAELVKQVLAFGRRQPAARAPAALLPVVDEVLRLVRHAVPAGVRIEVRCAEGLPPAVVDATQMQQVLVNLVTNAVHAVDPASGRVRIEVDEAPPGGAARRLRLRVSDDGHGMDAATADRAFEPFFTTKPLGTGTGLGLAEVHGIMMEHGGTVTVETAPGRGATFTLVLPAGEAAATAAPAVKAASAPAPALPPARVLLIDDEEALLRVGRRMLERMGHRVTAHASPVEAMAALDASPGDFDVVVTDLSMPGLSGYEVARAAGRVRADLPVVLLSGMAMTEAETLGGPNRVFTLSKPYTRESLMRVLGEALRPA